MIFYFESRTYLKIQYNTILHEIDYHLENQNKKLETLLKCLSNLLIQQSNSTNNSDKMAQLLEKFKTLVDSTKENINNLKALKTDLEGIFPSGAVKNKYKLDAELKSKLIEFNETAEKYKEKIYSEVEDYDNFILEYVNDYGFDTSSMKSPSASSKMPTKDFTIIEGTDDEATEEGSSIASSETIEADKNISESIQQKAIPDEIIANKNTLIISETQQKVFLPYTIADLQEKLTNNSNYQSYQDIIDKEYTIPMSYYKNAVVARFKETYNLMKNKEKYGVLDSLDLALELAFNRLLNPAIITACNSLEELDIYLDYLDSNETNKFTIFQIKYEVLPRMNFRLKPAND